MISNISKGNGFRGCVDYCANKHGAEQIGGNMSGENPRDLAAEFGAIREHNQQCTRPVFHVSLSASPGERLTNEQWQKVADDYTKKMGFDDNQFVVYRHTDKGHDHVHIVINRIRTTELSVVHDGHDQRKTQTVLREIEKTHGLKAFEKDAEKSDFGYTADLKKKIDKSILDTRGDIKKFPECCKNNGVTVTLNQQSTGRIAGCSYSVSGGGKTLKGSDLGHGYKYSGIEKRVAKINEKTATSALQKTPGAAAAAGKLKNISGILNADSKAVSSLAAVAPVPVKAILKIARALEME